MNQPLQTCLLVGSAKQPRSNSAALGAYLLERLQERGATAETLFLHRTLNTEAGRGLLLAAVERADLLLLAFPLYVDSLPYLVVRALEVIAAHRRNSGERPPQSLSCLVNCGFPEARHNDTAMAICRCFARQAGFVWAGGLSLGGGEVIDGRPLGDLGWMVRNVVRALDLAAQALAAGRLVPEEAAALMARPLVPVWLYTLIGGRGWKKRATPFGAQGNLDDRPYEE